LQNDAPAHQCLRRVGAAIAQHVHKAEDKDDGNSTNRNGDKQSYRWVHCAVLIPGCPYCYGWIGEEDHRICGVVTPSLPVQDLVHQQIGPETRLEIPL
jgi:hypothetical protein